MTAIPTRPLPAAALLAAVAALAGCQLKPGGPPPQPPPPGVTVAKPVSVPVQYSSEYNGFLDAVETVEVKARVKGVLRDIHFQEGEEVEKGKKLYTIDPREYETMVAKGVADLAKMQADIDNWNAQIKLAEAELARANRAMQSGGAAATEVDKAQAALDVNKAQLAVAKAARKSSEAGLGMAKLDLEYTTIGAEIAGRINRTLVTRGNLVGQDKATVLTTIVSMDPLYVYFDVPERDLVEYQMATREQKLPAPTSGTIPVEVGVTGERGFPHAGVIDFRENKVDTSTGTVRIRGRVPNPQLPPHDTRLLYPGLYARVRVPSGPPQPRLVVPEEALQTGQDGRYVLVVGAEDKVERRPVTVGPVVWKTSGDATAPGWTLTNPNPPAPKDGEAKKGPAGPPRPSVLAVVAIEKGLTPDDRVVVNGLQRARPGGTVTPDLWAFAPPPAKAAPAPEKK